MNTFTAISFCMENHQGTAFWISDQCAVTAYHVLPGLKAKQYSGEEPIRIRIRTPEFVGNTEWIVAGYNEDHDVAIIKFQTAIGSVEGTMPLRPEPQAVEWFDRTEDWWNEQAPYIIGYVPSTKKDPGANSGYGGSDCKLPETNWFRPFDIDRSEGIKIGVSDPPSHAHGEPPSKLKIAVYGDQAGAIPNYGGISGSPLYIVSDGAPIAVGVVLEYKGLDQKQSCFMCRKLSNISLWWEPARRAMEAYQAGLKCLERAEWDEACRELKESRRRFESEVGVACPKKVKTALDILESSHTSFIRAEASVKEDDWDRADKELQSMVDTLCKAGLPVPDQVRKYQVTNKFLTSLRTMNRSQDSEEIPDSDLLQAAGKGYREGISLLASRKWDEALTAFDVTLATLNSYVGTDLSPRVISVAIAATRILKEFEVGVLLSVPYTQTDFSGLPKSVTSNIENIGRILEHYAESKRSRSLCHLHKAQNYIDEVHDYLTGSLASSTRTFHWHRTFLFRCFAGFGPISPIPENSDGALGPIQLHDISRAGQTVLQGFRRFAAAVLSIFAVTIIACVLLYSNNELTNANGNLQATITALTPTLPPDECAEAKVSSFEYRTANPSFGRSLQSPGQIVYRCPLDGFSLRVASMTPYGCEVRLTNAYHWFLHDTLIELVDDNTIDITPNQAGDLATVCVTLGPDDPRSTGPFCLTVIAANGATVADCQ